MDRTHGSAILSETNPAFAEEFKALHDKVKESAINRVEPVWV